MKILQNKKSSTAQDSRLSFSAALTCGCAFIASAVRLAAFNSVSLSSSPSLSPLSPSLLAITELSSTYQQALESCTCSDLQLNADKCHKQRWQLAILLLPRRSMKRPLLSLTAKAMQFSTNANMSKYPWSFNHIVIKRDDRCFARASTFITRVFSLHDCCISSNGTLNIPRSMIIATGHTHPLEQMHGGKCLQDTSP